jgi:hypothetical protein
VYTWQSCMAQFSLVTQSLVGFLLLHSLSVFTSQTLSDKFSLLRPSLVIVHLSHIHWSVSTCHTLIGQCPLVRHSLISVHLSHTRSFKTSGHHCVHMFKAGTDKQTPADSYLIVIGLFNSYLILIGLFNSYLIVIGLFNSY